GRSGAFSSVVRSFMRRSPVDWSRADKLAAAREFASTNAPQSSAFRVCSKITSDFGGSAAWPDARREVLPHGHQEHPRQWAVTDEQRSRWPGAAPPRRAGAVWLSGVVARSLQTHEGYARRSRLASQPNSRQQNRNLFLNRPLRNLHGTLGDAWS